MIVITIDKYGKSACVYALLFWSNMPSVWMKTCINIYSLAKGPNLSSIIGSSSFVTFFADSSVRMKSTIKKQHKFAILQL